MFVSAVSPKLKVVVIGFLLKEEGTEGEIKEENKTAGMQQEIERKQQQLEELTEKLENAQRTQKQLFLIVIQVLSSTVLNVFLLLLLL